MQYAEVVRLQGELLSAEDANYYDYKGLLRCPVCHKVVFLRRAHERGGYPVKASFVHHKDVDATSCELRVNAFTKEQIDTHQSKSHNQRIKLLSRYALAMLQNTSWYQEASAKVNELRHQGLREKIYKSTRKTITSILKTRWSRELIVDELKHMKEENFVLNKRLASEKGDIILKYEDVRNAEIGFMVIEFCTSQGLKTLTSIIPVITVLVLHMVSDSKVIEIALERFGVKNLEPYLLVNYALLCTILNIFTFLTPWDEQFSKAERGEYIHWKLED